jgi:hypothetical protein
MTKAFLIKSRKSTMKLLNKNFNKYHNSLNIFNFYDILKRIVLIFF